MIKLGNLLLVICDISARLPLSEALLLGVGGQRNYF